MLSFVYSERVAAGEDVDYKCYSKQYIPTTRSGIFRIPPLLTLCEPVFFVVVVVHAAFCGGRRRGRLISTAWEEWVRRILKGRATDLTEGHFVAASVITRIPNSCENAEHLPCYLIRERNGSKTRANGGQATFESIQDRTPHALRDRVQLVWFSTVMASRPVVHVAPFLVDG